MIEVKEKSFCCGCNACVQCCPKQCIIMHEDEEGFLYPTVNKDVCVDCGLCESVCPFLQTTESVVPIQVLAAKNKDENVRINSSSGGIFYALANSVIHEGGVVFGAVYDDSWEVKIACAEKLEDIKPMMGSKYVQSKVGDAYKIAESFLKQGREVLFTGTPCQIAGLKKFLGKKKYSNLFAVDIICHGVPSPGVWRKYLTETFGEDSVAKQSPKSSLSLSSIEFRNKLMYGWKNFGFVVRGVASPKQGENSVLMSDIFSRNPYMKGFMNNLYLRPSCHACNVKNLKSGSDITLGDYWGIASLIADYDDDRGVSAITVNTAKGKSLLDRLDIDCRETEFSELCCRNSALISSSDIHPNRNKFYHDISKRTIKDNVKRYTKRGLISKIKGKLLYFRCISKKLF